MVIDCFLRGTADMKRRIEIRLAERHTDHIDAGGFHLFRPRRHNEALRGRDILYSLGELHISDSVYERLLLAVKHRDTRDKEHKDDDCRIAERSPRELSRSVSAIFESLDDSRHRVKEHDLMECGVRDITERINDRRCVHPERYEDTEEIGQVTILGSQGRDDESQAQRQTLNHQNQHREQKEVPVRTQVYSFEDKEQIHDHEGTELERETEEFGRHDRYRRHQPREIDLSEEACVRLESIGNRRKTLREILPKADAGEVKDRLRYIIRRNTGNAAKDHDVHEHREKGRDKIPPHTEDSLLKLDGDVTLNEEPNEVFLSP